MENMNGYHFIRAAADDANAAMEVYKGLLGVDGCTWNEFYPTIEDISLDIEHDGLYLLKNNADEIVAAIAIEKEGEDDELSACDWHDNFKNPVYLARLAVRRTLNNRGFGRYMMVEMAKVLKHLGYDGARILVSPHNPRALHIYESIGYMRKGEVRLYDQDWFLESMEL